MATFSQDCFDIKYKDTDSTTKTRTVGLELEVVVTDMLCPLHRDNRDGLADEWIDDDDYYDDDERDSDVAAAMKDWLDEQEIPFAGVGFDGNDIELVTHPDSMSYYLEGGSERFKKCMSFLKKNCVGGDKAVNSGTHVNVGKLENDDQDYIMDNAYWICMNFATQLQKIAGRVTHWAAFEKYNDETKMTTIPLDETFKVHATAVNMQKPDKMGTAKKYMNKSAFLVNKTHTYEFRLFKSTVDKTEALAWVELCHNIIQLASGQKQTKDITFIDLIKGEYIYNYVKKLKGFRKITEEEIKATIENTLMFKCYSSGGTIIL